MSGKGTPGGVKPNTRSQKSKKEQQPPPSDDNDDTHEIISEHSTDSEPEINDDLEAVDNNNVTDNVTDNVAHTGNEPVQPQVAEQANEVRELRDTVNNLTRLVNTLMARPASGSGSSSSTRPRPPATNRNSSKRSKRRSPSPQPSTDDDSSDESSDDDDYLDSKLPRNIRSDMLPKFNDSVLEWAHYSNTMERLVINNDEIGDCMKTIYLVQSTALAPIAHEIVKQQDANRKSAKYIWKKLCKKFQNNDQCHSELTKEARMFPIVKSRTDVSGLKAAYNRAVWFKTNMKLNPKLALGIQPVLILEISHRILHDQLRWEFNRDCKTFKDVVNFFEVNHQAAQANSTPLLQSSSSSKGSSNSNSSSNSSSRSNRHGGAVNHVSENYTPVCVFDGERHYYKDCPIPIQRRNDIVREKRLCFSCLSSKHRSRDCSKNKKCQFCPTAFHHRALCSKAPAINPVHETAAKTIDEPVTNHLNHVHRGKQNFKTITAFCSGEGPSDPPMSRDLARAMFDEGANCNFIHQDLVKRLNLKTVTGEARHFNTFGDSTPAFSSSQYCRFTLRRGHQTANLSAVVVPSFGAQNYGAPDSKVIRNANERGFYPYDDAKLPVEILLGLPSSMNLLGQFERMGNYMLQRSEIGDLCYGGLDCAEPSMVNRIQEILSTVPDSETESKTYNENFLAQKVKRDADGRIEVSMPWILPIKLNTNFNLCRNRLLSTVTKLKKTGLFSEYQQIITEYESLSIIKRVPISHQDCHYLNHHAVIREDKTTTKVRMVFDAAAIDSNGKSLNHCLFKGFVEWDLLRTLIQFRSNKHAFTSDITKAFLMISVNEEDRKYLRFIWIDSKDDLIAYEFQRVPFGTTASPFLLYAALAKVFQDHPLAAQSPINLLDHFYVDDFLVSSDSLEDAQRIASISQEILQEYGFTLAKHFSNFPLIDDSPSTGTVSTLGLNWTLPDDKLTVKPIDLSAFHTPRQLSSLIARFYDVLGIISPYIMELRRILSEGWKETKEWDAPLSRTLTSRVSKLIARLPADPSVERCIDAKGCTLVVYTDANKETIGCVAYAVNNNASHLVYAKGLLRASKSVPEAELSALSLGFQYLPYLQKILSPSRIIIYCDSQINVDRMSVDNINRLKPNIALRILRLRSIQEETSAELYHIATDLNLADHLTKLNKISFDNWLHPTIVIPPVPTIVNLVTEPATPMTEEQADNIITYFSSGKSLAELTPLKHELEDMVIATQIHAWGDDYYALLEGKRLSKRGYLNGYRCFADKGVIFVHLRSAPDDVRTFLPPRSYLADLIMTYIHEKRLKHSGHRELHHAFSETYFMEGAKALAYRITQRCAHCYRLRAKQRKPPSGILPAIRTETPDHAFQFISLDFAGPMKIAGKAEHYILLIRCLSSGAVFLKRLCDQTAASVFNAISQLASILGKPSVIYSDNAKGFKRCAKWIQTIQQNLEKEAVNDLDTTWRFSIAHAPHTNGITERMIDMFKKRLKAVTLNKTTTPLELELYLAQIAAQLNSRPLYYTDAGVRTPFHLILGRAVETFPLKRPSKEYKDVPLINFVKLQRRINGFWREWQKYYFLSLREQVSKSADGLPSFEIGTHVLLQMQPKDPRDEWLCGEVTKLHPGPDGVVRSIDVKVAKNGKTYERRSVTRCVPLPVGEDVADTATA